MHFQPPYKLRSFNLLEYTWKIYRSNFVIFFQLSAAALLPLIAVQIFLVSFRVNLPNAVSSIIDLAQTIWALLPTLAMLIVTENMMKEGPSMTFSQALKQGTSHWLHLTAIYFVIWIISLFVVVPLIFLVFITPAAACLMVIFVLGTVVVTNYLQFIPQMIALRSDHPGNPIKNSWQLVKGQWWTAFGRTLLLSLVIGAVSMLIILPLMPLFEESSDLALILLYLYSILINPVVFIYQTLLFRMLEARKGNSPLSDVPDRNDIASAA